MNKHRRELCRALERNGYDVLGVETGGKHLKIKIATRNGPRFLIANHSPSRSDSMIQATLANAKRLTR